MNVAARLAMGCPFAVVPQRMNGYESGWQHWDRCLHAGLGPWTAQLEEIKKQEVR